MNNHIRALLSTLADKAYRALFVETQVETLIPFQIRAMRESRGWTQKQLASLAGMAQGRISLLESPKYESAVTVKTLVKLADAFDVALVVRFAPFSELAEWSTLIGHEHHDVPDFSTEMGALDTPTDDEEFPQQLHVIIGAREARDQFATDDTYRTAA